MTTQHTIDVLRLERMAAHLETKAEFHGGELYQLHSDDAAAIRTVLTVVPDLARRAQVSDELLAALEKIQHCAEQMRIWSGQGWTYHPIHAGIIYSLADAARAKPKEPICTCPSGDGSLRWPCPRHLQECYQTKIDRLTACAESLQAAPSVPDIKTLVDRFLTWPLPDTFAPDAGISFNAPDERWWPTGTNLFTATEAQQMLEYVLSAAPESKP